MIGAVLGLQRAAGNRATSMLIQRIEDDDLAELLKDKANKKVYEAARTKYDKNFGSSGQYKDYHGAETWHYWVEKADSLANLTTLIDNAVTAAAAPPPPLPTVTAVLPPPSTASSSSTPSLPSTVSPPQPQPQPKKKKKKRTVVPLSQVFTGGSTTTQQTVDELITAMNPQVQQLITAKPGGATRVVGDPSVSEDTVYYTLTVYLPVDHTQGYPRRQRYELEVHHHPVPTTANYLHIKARTGGSAANIVKPDNWLMDRGKLNAGVAAWNAAKPTQSTQTF